MTGTRHNILSGLTAEQVSTRVLVVLVVLAVVVFNAFFLIGYDVPFEDNPEFNAPRLTDLVLVFIYVLVLLAAILAVTAIAISLKARDKAQGKANNIPSAKIAWGTAGLLVAHKLIARGNAADKHVHLRRSLCGRPSGSESRLFL